jgi:copper resistance protein C
VNAHSSRTGRGLAAPLLLALAVLTGMAVAQTAAAPAASAHDVLVRTLPTNGANVVQPPAKVTLVFEEPPIALGAQVVIQGPDGPAQTGRPELVGNEVRQAVKAGAPAGHYTVNWRVTSDDGHPISGSFGFTAAKAQAAGAQSGTPSGPGSASATRGTSSASSASSGARPTSTVAPAGPTQKAGQSGQDNPGGGPSAKVWVIIAIVIVLLVAAAEFVRRRRRREP